MKVLICSLTCLTAWISTAALAAISQHPVILIHGFQASQLEQKPNAQQVAQTGEEYWQSYWLSRADERIDWSSHERVQGKIASDYVWPKLQSLSRNNTCSQGCIIVTHSTGDLIARHILDNQKRWLENAGMAPLNIIATLDFAGAGGGSELADMAINAAEGGGVGNWTLRQALSLWLGMTPTTDNVGVLNDLKVGNARQLSPSPDSRVPRIRVVGDSSDFWGLTGGFLPGHDDGVVAAHSSCGAQSSGSYNSCSSFVAIDGKLAAQPRGVTSFMAHHYPLLMGEDYSHSTLIENAHEGRVAPVRVHLTLPDGSKVRVLTEDQSSWWSGNTYRYVKDSDSKSMSQLTYDLLEGAR
ncbi:hypothetical protein VINI7043_01480 [Vibrio nigripulchritudo ATCC 27043]|uniref:hypothetical protein n=1 Tax=Vibrio nigripulchritudo TaxID=28173 RepID=UPI00021C0DA5|nr:hypothetical protein [Vibrio nigripulchritudo]EGU60071.1 hypothetical protein VINI7043_01480 [Vibrio nigripulchritudo ATCC 27043]